MIEVTDKRHNEKFMINEQQISVIHADTKGTRITIANPPLNYWVEESYYEIKERLKKADKLLQ